MSSQISNKIINMDNKIGELNDEMKIQRSVVMGEIDEIKEKIVSQNKNFSCRINTLKSQVKETDHKLTDEIHLGVSDNFKLLRDTLKWFHG